MHLKGDVCIIGISVFDRRCSMEENRSRFYTRLNMVMFCIFPVVSYFILDMAGVGYEYGFPIKDIVNALLFISAAWMLFMCFGHAKAVLIGQAAISLLWGFVNNYLIRFRSSQFQLRDIPSLRTALAVAGNYNYMPGWQQVLGIAAFVILTADVIKFLDLDIKDVGKMRPLKCIVSVCVLGTLICILGFTDIVPYTTSDWDPAVAASINGTAVDFIHQLRYFINEEPDGYNRTEIAADMSKNINVADGEQPNIIVIMCEAFSDPAVL